MQSELPRHRLQHWLAARIALVWLGFMASSAIAVGATTAPAGPKAAVAAFALWSDEGVFLSEATKAARLVASRYGHGGAVLVRSNSRKSFAAGPDGMLQALRSAERGLDPDHDVLFVVLSSHGAPDGIAEKGGAIEGLLAPASLAKILSASRVKQKVLIVSACYAGIFTELAGPDLLVITAADATHPSFGCEAGATWTYFGDAFFNKALRRSLTQHAPLDRVFALAATLVRQRELAKGFDPSNPQLAGGAHVLETLNAMR